jgi:MFS family permease
MKIADNWTVWALRVLLPCTLAQSFVTGLTYGSFGTLLAANEAYFGVSRAALSTGIGIFNLAVALIAPVAGGMMHKVPIRLAMMAGALVSALAYFALAYVHSFAVALSLYGVLGICSSVLGILGPATLISRWFVKGRGRALGVIYLPVVLLLMPFITAQVLGHLGRAAVMIGIGLCFLLLLPMLAAIAEHPPRMPVSEDRGEDLVNPARASAGDLPIAASAIVTEPRFWLLSLGIGIMAGAGTGAIIHIVPFGTERHMALQLASILLTAYAATGLFGTPLLGWAADRFGAAVTLTVSSLCQAVLWSALLHVSGASVFVLAAMMGLCVSPVNTLHAAAMNEIFPVASVSRALGLSYAIKLPFILGTAPTMALLYERGGSYSLPFTTMSALMFVASIVFAILYTLLRQRRSAVPA